MVAMPETDKKLKLVYVTPALYMAGGVERVLTLKANYFNRTGRNNYILKFPTL